MATSSSSQSNTAGTSIASHLVLPTGFLKLTKHQLADDLVAANVRGWSDQTSKPTMQAMWCLLKLGLLDGGGFPDMRLVSRIARWCDSTASSLRGRLEKAGFEVQERKADMIRALIKSFFDDEISAFSQLTISGLANRQELGDPPLPSHQVFNLLVHSIFAEVAQTQSLETLPGHKFGNARSVLQILGNCQPVNSPAELVVEVGKGLYPKESVPAVICSAFGHEVTFATGNQCIPGFPKAIHQFIVNITTPTLEAQFTTHFLAAGSTSMLLFHGTPLHNLRSILRKGFYKSSYERGVWLALNPSYSFDFINKYPSPIEAIWPNSPYLNYGALLGCEVAGSGEPLMSRSTGMGTHHPIHVVSELRSVIVRYVFLLPLRTITTTKANMPLRSMVERAMLAGFANMRTARDAAK